MASTLISLFVGFILTGIVGTWLSQRWQHRSWINQQQILGEEKAYNDLTAVWDELTALSAKRLWRTRRLLFAVKGTDLEKAKSRLGDYDSIVSDWNEKVTSLSVRLTLFATWHLTKRLEELQTPFVDIGAELERAFRTRMSGNIVQPRDLRRLENRMKLLSHEVFEFNRDVLRAVEAQRAKTYYGTEVEFRKNTLEYFGTWELVKALFKPGIKPLRVIRTSAELPCPFRGRR
jgi:hypothetical protein